MHTLERGKFEEAWKNVFDGAELTPSNSIWNSMEARLSNAKGSNTGFEKGLKKVFQNAEMTPSKEVWKAIDVSLVQFENASFKKRVFYYQRIAAASVGIMIMFGAYSWFTINQSGTDLLSDSKSPRKDEIVTKPNYANAQGSNQIASDHESTKANNAALESSGKDNPRQDNSESVASNQQRKEPNTGALQNNQAPSSNQSLTTDKTALVHKSNTSDINGTKSISNFLTSDPAGANTILPIAVANNNNSLIAVSTIPKDKNGLPGKDFKYQQGPISVVKVASLDNLPEFFGPNDYSIAYRLADAKPAVHVVDKKKYALENKWASVGFSAGSFYPGIGKGAATPEFKSIRAAQVDQGFAPSSTWIAPTANDERIKPGTSMAVAITGGKRFLKRWLFQGGVTYINQTSSSERDVVAVAPANQVTGEKSDSYSLESTNVVTYESVQEINSNYQYINVPLQFGYMLVDKKLGLQINGGLSPDFLIKNTVYNTATLSETQNSADNLNSVSISGVGGLEVSYRFLSHYRISLYPGIKYSLTSIYVYSDNSMASVKPVVADLGLRFRYIF